MLSLVEPEFFYNHGSRVGFENKAEIISTL